MRIMLYFIVVAVIVAFILTYVIPLLVRGKKEAQKAYDKENETLNPPEKKVKHGRH